MSQKKANSPENETIDSWEACPPGALSKMVHRVDARQRGQRRAQVFKTALVSTAVFACVVLGLGIYNGSGSSHYGGITCSFCHEHMAEYAPHIAGELVHEDVDFVASMETHLEKCTFCRGDFIELYPNHVLTAATATRPAFAFAQRPLFAISQPRSIY